jgi:Secretion system C-terminal sorting domain
MDKAMRTTILLATLTFWSGALAQTWCPPGAEWWYNYQSAGRSGYVHLAYAGDTLVDGELAQRLDPVATGFDFWIDMPFFVPWPPVFTRSAGGQVSYRADTTWRLLFDLDVLPGGAWIWVDLAGADRTVAVLDTGHMAVDGTLLRYSVVSFTPPFGSFQTDTIIERIGFRTVYIDPYRVLGIDGDVQALRCYADQDVGYSTGVSETCDFILGTPERFGPSSIQLYPNPGFDHLTLQGNGIDPRSLIKVIDPLNRNIASFVLGSSERTLDVSAWASGLYLVEVISNQGLRSVSKWMKP